MNTMRAAWLALTLSSGIALSAFAGCGGSSGGSGMDASADTGPKDAGEAGKRDGKADSSSNLATLTVVVGEADGGMATMVGSVTADDHSIYCGYGGPCTAKYPPGTQVNLREVAALNYEFASWGGACSTQMGSPTCSVLVYGDVTVTANWKLIPTATLTVTVTGGGTTGMVTSMPPGISTNMTETASFDVGTSIMLNAMGSGYYSCFKTWVGGQCAGDGGVPTSAMCTVKLMKDDTETAQFGSGCFYNCPYLFGYDGKGYVYETGLAGGSVASRHANLLQKGERDFASVMARLDHSAVDYSSGTGVARAKVVAAEDEIVYLDRASLVAVEHPKGYEVLTSSPVERGQSGDARESQTFALRTDGLRAPVAANWMNLQDVTASVSRDDEVPAKFDRSFGNYYELDFGPASAGRSAKWLVVDGWKFTEARRLAAGVKQERPRIDVRQADGTWKTALTLGTIRGGKKPLAFDLTGVAFPSGRYEVRLFTGTDEDAKAMWYVDRVRITEEAAVAVHPKAVAMEGALLGFTGAPSIVGDPASASPPAAVDDGKGELGAQDLTFGRFTRYGDVSELLAAPDDQMVVMRRGDGVALSFKGVPKPAAGNEVSVLLSTDLVFKPHRMMGADGPGLDEVEPLPFHGMGQYPPAAPFPADSAHKAWLAKYQTREYKRGDTRWGP